MSRPADAIAALEAENDALTRQRDEARAEVRQLTEQLAAARDELFNYQHSHRGAREVVPRASRVLQRIASVSPERP